MISDSFEREQWSKGKLVFGIDESGMGSIAGSMFIGLVLFKKDYDFSEKLSKANDSKQLSAKRRFELERIIKEEALEWFCEEVTPEMVDKVSAYHARLHAASGRLATYDREMGRPENYCVLMDGNVKIDTDPWVESHCLVKGDTKSYTLASASIIAKCAKDREMIRLDKDFPEYQWASNKGYETKAHSAGIKKCGLTKYHRWTFCKKYIKES